MRNVVTVRISGPQGTYKSTLAKALKLFLLAAGKRSLLIGGINSDVPSSDITIHAGLRYTALGMRTLEAMARRQKAAYLIVVEQQ